MKARRFVVRSDQYHLTQRRGRVWIRTPGELSPKFVQPGKFSFESPFELQQWREFATQHRPVSLPSIASFSSIDRVEGSNYSSWKPRRLKSVCNISYTGLSPTWYNYQLQCSPHLSQESPQPSFRCSPPSSLLTLRTHLSMNMLPTITSYVDKATSKPVSNVHPDWMIQLTLSLPKYIRPFLHCHHGQRVILSSNSKLAAEKCQTFAAQPREVNAYLEICFRTRLPHVWSKECIIFRRREAIPLRHKFKRKLFQTELMTYHSSVSRRREVLPRQSARGRSQSDCTFPANVGSSHSMSCNRESRKRDRVPFDDFIKWNWSEKGQRSYTWPSCKPKWQRLCQLKWPICTEVSGFTEVRHKHRQRTTRTSNPIQCQMRRFGGSSWPTSWLL